MFRALSLIFILSVCAFGVIASVGGCGKSDSKWFEKIDLTPPKARIAVTGDLVIGGVVRFDGRSSGDDQGWFDTGIKEWRWDVYGDNVADGFGPILEWTWDRPGTYMINLVVTDWGGVASPAESVMVTIGPPDTQWPGVGRDFHHTGYVDSALSVFDNSTAWVSDEIGYSQGSGIAIAASMVFVACNNGSWTGVTALQLSTGDIVWQSQLDNIGGWGFWTSRGSCAYSDGCLYITAYTSLLKLDAATGGQLDIYDFEEYLVDSDVLVADGKVFVGSFEYNGNGFFAAVDASDFTLLWKKEYPGGNCNPAPAYDGGVLYVGMAPSFGSLENAAMMALDAETGDEIWKKDSPNGFAYYAPLTVYGDYVYGATFSFNMGDNTTVVKRSKVDGAVEWVRECGTASTPPVVTDNHVLVAGGSYGSVYDGRTTCYSIDGTPKWDKTGLGSWTGQPVVLGSLVFTCDYYGDVYPGYNQGFYCLNISDGTEVWSYDGCGGSPSVVIVGGTVYVMVGSHDGQIYCFGG